MPPSEESADGVPQGTIHWMHPRWHGEEPLFKIMPGHGPLNEYWIAKKMGPHHAGVRGRWWYVETEDGIEKRAEVIGYKTAIPEWVEQTLLGYENTNYGPIEKVLNPVDDSRHDDPADPSEMDDEQQQLVTDGGHYGPPPNTGRVHDPGPAPEDACIECGDYGGVRCGCCGFPLCGRHHEVGGGFCTKFTVIGNVPTCAYDHEVYVRPLPRPDGEEPFVLAETDAAGTVFHLPDPDGSGAPFCGGLPASRVTGRPLGDSLIDRHDLCSACAEAAKYERRARKRLVGRDLRRQRGETA